MSKSDKLSKQLVDRERLILQFIDMRDFHNFIVWQRAHAFSLQIYRISKKFPKDEIFGMTSQIRRAATSIPINIAEGCGRRTDSEFAYFLDVAAGSASEVEEELLLSRDLEFINIQTFQDLDKEVKEIKAMLGSLIDKLK